MYDATRRCENVAQSSKFKFVNLFRHYVSLKASGATHELNSEFKAREENSNSQLYVHVLCKT